MRKIGQIFCFLIPVIACAVIMVFMAGCEKKTEKNKALARRDYQEVWNQGKLDAVDEIFAADYVSHWAGSPDIHGTQSYKQSVTSYRTAFPDVQFTVEDQIAEGDKVVTRWTSTGTHKGELMGIPPTGVQVTLTGISISRLSDDKVVEDWVNWDMLGMLQQLGVIPPMGGEVAAEASDRVRFGQQADADDPTTVGGRCPVCERIVEEVWDQGKLDALEEIFAADYVCHMAGSPDLNGPKGYKQFVTMYRSAFPDVHITVEDIIVEGDKVAGRWTLTGTHQGEFVGIPPTGVQVTVTGMTIHSLSDDKVVEDWMISDALGMLQQLGVVPPMGKGGE